MKATRILMDMPITVDIVDKTATAKMTDAIFNYFKYIDEKFSPFKPTSELSQINTGRIDKHQWSRDMQMVFKLSLQTKRETNGYFDIRHNDKYNPSGLVKGWAIYNAANLLKKQGVKNFFIDAGGDIQVAGKNHEEKKWRVGIRNPFNRNENIKIIFISHEGVATSGTYIRGQHIYNPHEPHKKINDIVSLTVIAPNIYEADRFVTAAFAMGKKGIEFISELKGFEGYMIDCKGIATFTSGFNKYVKPD